MHPCPSPSSAGTSSLHRRPPSGVQFLWNNIVTPSASLLESQGLTATQQCSMAEDGGVPPHSATGCILAHSMGLGKTLTSIAFIFMYLQHRKGRTVLVIAPKSTLHNWANEFRHWYAGMRWKGKDLGGGPTSGWTGGWRRLGGGYCRLHMPLRLAFAVRETVAGCRPGAQEGGRGVTSPPRSHASLLVCRAKFAGRGMAVSVGCHTDVQRCV